MLSASTSAFGLHGAGHESGLMRSLEVKRYLVIQMFKLTKDTEIGLVEFLTQGILFKYQDIVR